MKKTALIFGLFSLVVVATSFEAPVKTNTEIAGIDIMLGTDGTGQLGKDGRHKADFVEVRDKSNINYNNSIHFDTDRQSKRIDVKLD